MPSPWLRTERPKKRRLIMVCLVLQTQLLLRSFGIWQRKNIGPLTITLWSLTYVPHSLLYTSVWYKSLGNWWSVSAWWLECLHSNRRKWGSSLPAESNWEGDRRIYDCDPETINCFEISWSDSRDLPPQQHSPVWHQNVAAYVVFGLSYWDWQHWPCSRSSRFSFSSILANVAWWTVLLQTINGAALSIQRSKFMSTYPYVKCMKKVCWRKVVS